MLILVTANHNENCRFCSQKEKREEKSEERCLVSKQQLTLGAARAAGWVPEFPCFCLHLHILFLRNLTCLTSWNMSGFTLPSDTQPQCTVIESLWEQISLPLFLHLHHRGSLGHKAMCAVADIQVEFNSLLILHPVFSLGIGLICYT